jgi:TolB-like protein
VPDFLARAVHRALARSPGDRFATAGAMLAALNEDSQTARGTRIDTAEKSIAVLPFANMSADPENEFFTEGMT